MTSLSRLKKAAEALRKHALAFPETVEEFPWGHSAIKVKLKISEIADRFQPETELTVFRICQEALNNVAKHAQAEHLLVEIQQVGTELVVLIKDDGVGFDSDDLQSARAGRRGTGKQGVGLLGMRERAAAVNGSLELKSVKGHGSEICLKVPTIWPLRRGE